MIVKATNRGVPPPHVEPYMRQAFVTVSREYEVHAVSVFKGVVAFQIVDDLGYPSWEPAWLFDLTDCSIPDDWVCGVFHGELSLVLGPEFIAANEQEYNRMVELEAEQVGRFWQRLDRRGVVR